MRYSDPYWHGGRTGVPALRVLTLVLAVTLGGVQSVVAGESSVVDLKWKHNVVGRGEYSSVAVDPQGNTHVLLNREFKTGVLKLTHTWFEGRKKRSEVVDTGAGYGNALAVDAQGGLHACYAIEGLPGGWHLMYAHNDGSGWKTEVVEEGGQSISMQVDDQGVPHVLHINGNRGPFVVRYVRKTPGGWEGEEVHGNGLWFYDSSLLLRDGMVYAAFTTRPSTGPDSLIVATRDLQGQWTNEVVDDGVNSSAAFNDLGVLHVAYVSGSAVKHAWLNHSGWQRETLVTQTEFFGVPFGHGITALGQDVALAPGPGGRLFLGGALDVSKGNKSAGALWAAILDGETWVPDLIKSGRIGYRTWLATGPSGLAHVTTIEAANKISLFRLKGSKLRVTVRPAGAGTISVAPGGAECDDKCTLSILPGLELTLSATPAESFAFDEWRRGCSGSEPSCNLAMVGRKKVFARFKASVAAP